MENLKHIADEIKKAHQGDWKTFFKIYNWSSFKTSVPLWFSIITGSLFAALEAFTDVDTYSFLKSLVMLNLSILPSLLGFFMGAYALLLSGFSERILERIVDTKTIKTNSLQKTSSVFGMILFVMAVSLTLNYLTSQILNLSYFERLNVSKSVAKTVNITISFILNVISTYSILLTANSVINLFAFSQYISGIMTVNAFESDIKARNSENKED